MIGLEDESVYEIDPWDLFLKPWLSKLFYLANSFAPIWSEKVGHQQFAKFKNLDLAQLQTFKK